MKTTNYFLTLTLFFCLNLSFSSAQIIPDVTPDNITETVDLIFELHGNNIDNDYASVYNFIDGLLPNSSNNPAYDSLCAPPDASLVSANSTSVSLSWNAVPGSINYTSAYLKLNQFPSSGPESGAITAPDTSVQITISSGLMILAFKNHCSALTSGKVSIIIVDTPIFFDAHDEDCECLDPLLPIEPSPFVDGESVTIDYTHEDETIGYYEGTIVNGDENANFLIKVDLTDEDHITIYQKTACMVNLSNPSPFTMLYHLEDGDDELVLGTINFSFTGIKYIPGIDGSSTGSFTLTECLPGQPPIDKKITPTPPKVILKAMPNPATEVVSILLPADLQQEKYSCFLVDPFGVQTYLPPNFYSFKNGDLEIKIDHLPNGVYSFIIHTSQQIITSRFVKVE